MSKVRWLSLCLLIVSARVDVRGNVTAGSTTEMTGEREDDSGETKNHSGDLDLETQDQVAILKQINRVNDDGSYTFGYEAADGSFKIETRDVNGNVKGIFGFVNENGELKKVSYSASNGTGFQSTRTSNIPPLPGMTPSPEKQDDRHFAKGRYDLLTRVKPEDASIQIDLPNETTPAYEKPPEMPSRRLPVYIFGSSTPVNEDTSSSRPVVIQHIPRVRPTPASSSTIPTESEEILLKPLLSDLAPKRTSNTNFISFGTNDFATAAPETTTGKESDNSSSVIQVIRPRPRNGHFKKVAVAKRPVATTTTAKVFTTTNEINYRSNDYFDKSKVKGYSTTTESAKGFRRQSGISNNYVTSTPPNLVTSGTEDNPDVFGGRPVSRPYPVSAYKTLFTQIPQHQRILQNSYNQNRNQYLAAGLGSTAVPTTTPTQVLPTTTQNPSQDNAYTESPTPPPQGANTLSGENNYVPFPVPQQVPDIPNPRQFEIPPNYVRFPATVSPPIEPFYQSEQFPNQIYIPPALLEHLIRMLLAARQRLTAHGQQAVIATLSTGNVPPEVLNNRYETRYYQPRIPYPNYSQLPANSYSDPVASRPPYDPRYPVPYYPTFVRFDPRYPHQSQTFSPVPYPGIQPQSIPYDSDPARQANSLNRLNALLGYQRFQSNPLGQPTSNVVARSSTYSPDRDTTTPSATTTAATATTAAATTQLTRQGPVRNVQILGQINDDSTNYDSNTAKPKK